MDTHVASQVYKLKSVERLSATERNAERPVPSLRWIDESGLITIAWDKRMVPIADVGELKTVKILVVVEDDDTD